MGIFDRAKDALSGQREHLDAAVEKVGDLVDEKTEGKYAEQVDKGQEMARDKVADLTPDEPERPAADPDADPVGDADLLADLGVSAHRLLELCALFDTLIADADGIYNPRDFNDRLLLGLKRPPP